MKPMNQNLRRARSGFTLVEILVVLVIASILAAITLGGYSAMRASNRRTSCQANMAQVYRSIRMYAADYDGESPYYNPAGVANGVSDTGIGLWAIYAYNSDGNTSLSPSAQRDTVAEAGVKPSKRYLTNPKLFHCPSDISGTNEQMFTDSANSKFNPNYLSYQTTDTGCPTPSDATCTAANGQYGTALFTYNPILTNAVSDGLAWQRQLLTYDGSNLINRPPTDNTVVLWCPFHRDSGSVSTDNVLFWDGSVQSLPENQNGNTGASRLPNVP